MKGTFILWYELSVGSKLLEAIHQSQEQKDEHRYMFEAWHDHQTHLGLFNFSQATFNFLGFETEAFSE